ncbi:hypothetical protein [Rhizobium lentis]|nr:hypothetical protein [Rhizobium lentis]
MSTFNAGQFFALDCIRRPQGGMTLGIELPLDTTGRRNGKSSA